MNAGDRERLSAAFQEAERSLPPLRPDRAATIERGRRLLRKRRLATLATAGALFAALTGGGIAARAALHDEEPTPTGKTTTRDDHRREDHRREDHHEKTTTLPDLAVTLTPTDEGATVAVTNIGDARAEAFVVVVQTPPPDSAGEFALRYDERVPEGLEPGEEKSWSYPCVGILTATVDSEQQVKESIEENNGGKAQCGPTPPSDITDTTGTAPPETATDVGD